MTRFNVYDAGIKVHPEAQAKCITTAIVLWYQSKHTEALMKRIVSDTGSI